MGRRFSIFVYVVSLCLFASAPADASPTPKDKDVAGAEVLSPDKHDISPALASIAPSAEAIDPKKPKKEKELKGFPQIATGAADTAVQATATGVAAPSAASSFEGIGQGQFGFTVQYAPPDTNGAVGPNHFVETVNVSFAVFSKTGGAPMYGPAAINTLFKGFGGLCETDNDGDPTVIYDQLADRWVIQQFAVTGANGGTVPYLECIAVSQTGDPLGTWNRYSYKSTRFPDYPKLGVWPDAYYLSTNDFNGNLFTGASLWAFDRTKMLAGDPTATSQVVHLSSAYGGLLPSSLDGKTPPPAGAPDYFVALGTSTSLYLWKYHVDFANAANSTVTGPTSIAVAGYTELCNGGTCVPQAGTTQQLDSLADRLMYRLAYRNFGDHEALVVAHSVAPTAGGGGVRWYEIRSPGGTPTVFQQSTYAPDTRYRWMPSAAMDQVGNIGVGYSESSSTMNPSIYFTGRLATDALNTLQAESLIVQGTGSQLATLKRWGDYSSMFVDPSDDCTFWYTSEYLAASGTFNWHTRIGTFKFANCPPGPPPAPTVTSVSPANGSQAGGTSVTINGTNFGSPATVAFGATAATNVTFVSASKLTATAPAGTGTVNVVVTNPDAQTGTCTACYTYRAAPTVTSVSPIEGPTAGGTSITITGTDFAAGLTTVSVGSAAATNVSVTSSTQLTATTPAGTAGAAPVVVTVEGQASNSTVSFNYFVVPAVTSVTPASGSKLGGTNVTVTGSNFNAPTSVTFGGAAATSVVAVSATQITATTPAGVVGTADVVVTNGDGHSGTCAACYTYLDAPTVTSVSPSTGSKLGGTSVTITGANFAPGATVTFGGAPATNIAFVSASKLTATAPSGIGAVDVVVTNDGQTGTCTACYTYLDPPTVTAVNPTEGPTAGGTTVTVTGTSFSAGQTAVTVGGTAATNVTVTSGTQLTAVTPAGIAGPASVVVTVDGQASNNTVTFTYFVPPTVTSVTPSSGSKLGGTNVTIAGSNFNAATSVTFGGVGATNVVTVSATQITATTPAGTVGTADVVVTNGDGHSGTCAACYTYRDAPTVTGISPASGPDAGGTAITITGTNFASGATVTVGGVAATGVTVLSATSITATTPQHAEGAAHVIVTVEGQTNTASPADVFTYGPTISNVSAATQRRSATITWTTDVPADSQVEYGTTTAYGSTSTLNTTLVTSHSVTLSGLARFTTYHYRVFSRDSFGRTTSSDFTFTTK